MMQLNVLTALIGSAVVAVAAFPANLTPEVSESGTFNSQDVVKVSPRYQFGYSDLGASSSAQTNLPQPVIPSFVRSADDPLVDESNLPPFSFLYVLTNDEDNILIQRVNSGEIICSLKSFQLNGDLANNPILKEGDVIRVAYNSEYSEELKASITHKQSLVFVTGFVLRPSGHKFLPGYSVNDYIAMSGGATDFGSLKNLSINRNGELLSMDTMNYLEPGDQINIPANMKYRMLGNMSLLQTLTAMMTLYLTYQAAIN